MLLHSMAMNVQTRDSSLLHYQTEISIISDSTEMALLEIQNGWMMLATGTWEEA